MVTGDGSECVDVDDVIDEIEKGEEESDRVVETSASLGGAPASPTAPGAALGDEKYVLT